LITKEIHDMTKFCELSVLTLQAVKYGGWTFDIFGIIKSQFGGAPSSAADGKAPPS
jgi:hypothetical protein